MIISTNSDPSHFEFESLIRKTIDTLNKKGQNSPNDLETLSGRNLEPYVCRLMEKLAKGTPFENSIELIGGQKFPDIVAKRYYGLEVKTTTQNHWKTTGNSVLETTRVEGVERIYMLFAKLASPIEFRCRPYEEVLSEVVVTHSPRYLIDMNLEIGETIFDKINIPYDTLRKKENPIQPIVEYYKKKLKPGDKLWWMDSDNQSKASNISLRIWNNLSDLEKQNFRNKARVYFPELFGKRKDKFNRISIWLVLDEGIVCPNVRDQFTSNGKEDFSFDNKVYKGLPRVLFNLFEEHKEVVETLKMTPVIELSKTWEISTKEETKLDDWIDLVAVNAKELIETNHLDIKCILNDLIK